MLQEGFEEKQKNLQHEVLMLTSIFSIRRGAEGNTI